MRSLIQTTKLTTWIVKLAKQHLYVIVREDLNDLVESVRKLLKSHRKKLILLIYRKLMYWIDWQVKKCETLLIVVNPREASTTCPRCRVKLREKQPQKIKVLYVWIRG